jgi:hypothetical protein
MTPELTTEERELIRKCKRCKGRGILVVDRGLHYTYCPDCHPAYAPDRAANPASSHSSSTPSTPPQPPMAEE